LPNNHSLEICTGIAEGNLGCNLLLRGEYDRAIPLLKSSLEIMTKHNDYAYASGTAYRNLVRKSQEWAQVERRAIEADAPNEETGTGKAVEQQEMQICTNFSV
jgi:hypothetical protein